MSDAVMIVAIPSAITTLGLIIIALINSRQNRLIAQKVDEVKKNTDGLVTAALAAKDETSQAKQELSKEIGKSEATAEAKIEIDKLNKESNQNL